MKNRRFKSILNVTVLALIALLFVQVATAGPCDDDITTFRVQYFPLSGTLVTNAQDSRASSESHIVRLEGSLHFRRESGQTLRDRPVLIFNHGHERQRGEACAIVRFFTGKGWIVFVPLRRGHVLDDDVRSTGLHIDRYVDLCMRSFMQAQQSGERTHLYCGSSYCRPDVPCGSAFKRNAVETGYLNEQRIDVRDQIAFVKTLQAITDGEPGNMKLVDPGQIVILGHSYGGTLITMTNAFDYGQNIAVSVSGAELSWGDDEPYWELDLLFAMQSQKRPSYFLQPKNGRTLLPTKRLFGAAIDNGFRADAAIFPPAPCDAVDDDGNCIVDDTPEWKQADGNFIGMGSQVKKWGPSVIEMSQRYKR